MNVKDEEKKIRSPTPRVPHYVFSCMRFISYHHYYTAPLKQNRRFADDAAISKSVYVILDSFIIYGKRASSRSAKWKREKNSENLWKLCISNKKQDCKHDRDLQKDNRSQCVSQSR